MRIYGPKVIAWFNACSVSSGESESEVIENLRALCLTEAWRRRHGDGPHRFRLTTGGQQRKLGEHIVD